MIKFQNHADLIHHKSSAVLDGFYDERPQYVCCFGGTKPAGTTETVQKSDPWSGQQPYLTSGFAAAQDIYNQGGPQYFPGQTYAGSNPQLQGGINALTNIGMYGTPGQRGAIDTVNSITDPNFLNSNPSNGTYNSAANGGMNVNTGGYFQPIASGEVSNTGGADTFNALSNGSLTNTGGVGTLRNFANGNMLSAKNPYFQQMAATTAANVQPTIEGQFAAGNRSDSGLGARALGLGLGDAIGGLAYNNYQQGLQQQESAANSLANIGQQNIGNRLAGATNLANLGQQNIGNRLAAGNALTSLGFGNNNTRLAGAAGQAQNFQSGIGDQLTAASYAPTLANMAYNQAGAFTGAGTQQQGLDQAAINDAVSRYNYQQQLPYSNLANYMNMIQGNYGGTSSTSTPYFQNQTADTLGTIGGIAQIGTSIAAIF